MKQRTPEEIYGPALERAIGDLQSLDAWLVALRSDTKYTSLTDTSGQIEVTFWGKDYIVHHPEISVEEVDTGQEPPIAVKILILHYLIKADGTRLADQWISFRELPDGHVYDATLRQRANLRPIVSMHTRRRASKDRRRNKTGIWAAGVEMRGTSSEPPGRCFLGARCARPQPPSSKRCGF